MTTRLQSFIAANEIKPAHLARASGVSRQHLLRLRRGVMDPRRITMVLLARGCSYLLGRWVSADELFDIAGDPVPLNGS
jgi:transcriptional regulator with XRE-family HTH domain